MSSLPYYQSFEQIKQRLGMIVPVWFPPDTSEEDLRSYLQVTLEDCSPFVEPERLTVVVDGPQAAETVVDEIERDLRLPDGKTFATIHLSSNRGKGGAVAAGMERLLEDPGIGCIIVRDADGDHVTNDTPNLVRLGAQIEAEQRTDNWVVVGGRFDLHRPLGFIRGQYELVVNSVLWHATEFFLAQQQKVINTQYLAAYGDLPDCESGYKAYGRTACQHLVRGFEEAQNTCPELDAPRWSCEVLPLVEILISGGMVGQVNRMTFDEQPVTHYGNLNRPKVYAARLAWVLRRLGIPLEVGLQLVDNALSRSLLMKEHEGREELLTLRRLAAELSYGEAMGEKIPEFEQGAFMC